MTSSVGADPQTGLAGQRYRQATRQGLGGVQGRSGSSFRRHELVYAGQAVSSHSSVVKTNSSTRFQTPSPGETSFLQIILARVARIPDKAQFHGCGANRFHNQAGLSISPKRRPRHRCLSKPAAGIPAPQRPTPQPGGTSMVSNFSPPANWSCSRVQENQRPSMTRSQVTRPTTSISGEPGPAPPAGIIPLQVPFRRKHESASVLAPGFNDGRPPPGFSSLLQLS